MNLLQDTKSSDYCDFVKGCAFLQSLDLVEVTTVEIKGKLQDTCNIKTPVHPCPKYQSGQVVRRERLFQVTLLKASANDDARI
eukprot:941247-Amphidinium_carterae.1